MLSADLDLVQSARSSFSRSSDDAAAKFRARSVRHKQYGCRVPGLAGEPLFTGVDWIGAADASDVLVLISGVHGAEGYCGSGLQVDLMSHGIERTLDASQAVMLVHGLNPYGFACDRRVTHEGCDLNRNFIDFARSLPENPDYDSLAALLTPRYLDGPCFDACEAQLSTLREGMGERRFQTARKSGQYKHPHGMFFGGFGPSEARLTLERITDEFEIPRRRFVTVIDIHTGLGPYGYGEIEDEHPSGSLSSRILRTMFGDSVVSAASGKSFSVPVTGTLASHFAKQRADGSYVYACLEFGTFDQENSRKILREDLWLHTVGRDHMNDEIGHRIRRAVRQHYFPDTQDWREAVLFRGRQVVRMAQHWMRTGQSAR